MRYPRRVLTLFSSLFLFIALVRAAGQPLLPRDGHGHHHAAPLLDLNETEVTLYHAPTPESYYTIDWEGAGTDGNTRHPGLMIAHATFMCLAFFGALPLGIILRAVNHGAHGFAVGAFYAFCALGCASSGLYTKLTPNMYPGSVHSRQGYFVLLIALSLSAIDILAFIRRLVSFIRKREPFSVKSFWTSVVLGKQPMTVLGPEYTGLVSEPDEFEEAKVNLSPTRESDDMTAHDDEVPSEWANNAHNHRRSHSTASDGTLFLRSKAKDSIQDNKSSVSSKSNLRRLGNIVYAIVERALVFAGLSQLLLGIVIYTGGCRQNYVNGCLAHIIKGAIFWCYGLVTFARFLGSFAELGWAWNRSPVDGYVSAEFVESLVIFGYGITNTWMERFGANPGDPFTTKQIQHIGIAVMFWFAGLVGMGIESKRIRRWLAASTFASINNRPIVQEAVVEPPSYSGSFNPFPALVIGVTGAAMAAHAQTYVFQVQIHELWGDLLVGFAVLRCLTYFFLWLSPPRSMLPSRPPTEALGSFFLACGGLVFMFSTEEVTIAAMRRGRDDMMMFLNVAVAITCLAFCWALCCVGLKGWFKSRIHQGVSYHSSA